MTEGRGNSVYKHSEITERILAGFYTVYNTLGYGFLEKENALAKELLAAGMVVRQQLPIQVYYRGEQVGDYFTDLLVDDAVKVEIKAAQSLSLENEAQLLNYLRATRYEVGLLLNFGVKPEVKRKIFENSRKEKTLVG